MTDLRTRAEAAAAAVCSRHDRWGWYVANKAALHALQSDRIAGAAAEHVKRNLQLLERVRLLEAVLHPFAMAAGLCVHDHGDTGIAHTNTDLVVMDLRAARAALAEAGGQNG